jgi:hypothetical protein
VDRKSILIFPAGMPRSVEYFNKIKNDGCQVIGSSSLAFDPARELYPAWCSLPYVSDPLFDDALQQLIADFDIGEIYTPNLVVWTYLDKYLSRLACGVVLANRSPFEEGLASYRKALQKAKLLTENSLPIALTLAHHQMPNAIELAGLCRYADLIPGMCDDDKLQVLLEITRNSVNGDIVEIGSWWGKSAFILAWLAERFCIGNVLCIDPWSNAHLVQNESIVDSGSAQVDADEAFDVFQIGLLPFNFKHINYLRKTSEEGALYYSENTLIYSEFFGETKYIGKISILHIDGNHSYNAVNSDIELWGKHVLDGGWIIFDDYMWPYGDGPKKVGDSFINLNQFRISNTFVMGGALFVQIRHNHLG